MPMREFTDAGGVHWQVWATTPTRGNVRPQFASGWLAFESGAERRRLAPIPTGWMDSDDGALRLLLQQAVPLVRGSGLPPLEDAGPGPGAEPRAKGLQSTVDRVHAVLRAVEDAWHHKKPD
jgi:hypothetical protein